jgi:hypothetical protein
MTIGHLNDFGDQGRCAEHKVPEPSVDDQLPQTPEESTFY